MPAEQTALRGLQPPPLKAGRRAGTALAIGVVPECLVDDGHAGGLRHAPTPYRVRTTVRETAIESCSDGRVSSSFSTATHVQRTSRSDCAFATHSGRPTGDTTAGEPRLLCSPQNRRAAHLLLRPGSEAPAQGCPSAIALSSYRQERRRRRYFRCLLTSLVISNMFTVALPPKTAFNAASALIMRLFCGSCSPFFLI